jgi:hypothetical protein
MKLQGKKEYSIYENYIKIFNNLFFLYWPRRVGKHVPKCTWKAILANLEHA